MSRDRSAKRPIASDDRCHDKSWLVAASSSRPHDASAAEGFGVTFHLTIGNKAYSSWSLRPWILLDAVRHPVRRDRDPARPARNPSRDRGRQSQRQSAGARCRWPFHRRIARHHGIRRPKSSPHLPVWPRDRAARATARALSSEMHAGFQALRQVCPTNFRREPKPVPIGPDVRSDIDRIEAAWRRRPSDVTGKMRPFPVRCLLGGRRHVRARGQSLSMPTPSRSGRKRAPIWRP